MDNIKDYINKCFFRKVQRGGGYGGGGGYEEDQYIMVVEANQNKIVINLAGYGKMDIYGYQLERIIETGKEISKDEWRLQTIR